MLEDKELRNQLVHLLTFRQAHMDFEDAAADFPEEHINTRPPNCDYTFWHLLEHLRICQKDILDYIESDNYQWLDFPNDLWPDLSITHISQRVLKSCKLLMQQIKARSIVNYVF